MEVNYCQFCLSNGESEVQYKSHTMKNAAGLVSCPVLRMYRCSICQATGDQAHTQRYCPLNRDGKYNGLGASLTDLKKKKNAAGNFPGTTKKLTWPLPSQEDVRTAFTGKVKTIAAKPDLGKPFRVAAPFDMSAQAPGIISEPLPSGMRPKTPPPVHQDQPESAQLTMYRHYQYLQYYREKMLKHTAEINRIQALRDANHRSIQLAVQQQSRYTRSFNPHPSPPLSSSPDGSRRNSLDTGDCVISGIKRSNVTQEIERMRITNPHGSFNKRMAMGLSDMLEELREGTEEVEMN